MSRETSERRARSDRRKAPRGGRRSHDQPGFTPLVLVVGHGGSPQQESERILRELKFAVAPAADLQEAIRVLDGLNPDLVVAQRDEASQLRARGSIDVPIVEHGGNPGEVDGLIDRIRQAIRQRR